MDKLAEGRRVFDIEIKALEKMRDSLDDTFVHILDAVVACKGKVVVTGMGKPGHVGTKIAATFASLGTPSFFLHPGEAMHGDLGMISPDDIVIAISYSGESDEIIKILPNIKMIGAKLIGITGNADSTLARNADMVQVFPSFDEACYLGLAPTSSTTVELCYGDALAVVASGIYGFQDADFGKFHPAGSLGKNLILKVGDLMIKGADNAIINYNTTLKDCIIELSKKRLGIVSVVDNEQHLVGVVTDGDLCRQLQQGVDVYSLSVEDVMSKHPIIINDETMAVMALKTMKEKNISFMPVVDDARHVIGTIRLKDLISVGIVC
jgi:arabinose-5-phosphate isomerase